MHWIILLHQTRLIKLYDLVSFAFFHLLLLFLSNNALHSSHRALWHMNERERERGRVFQSTKDNFLQKNLRNDCPYIKRWKLCNEFAVVVLWDNVRELAFLWGGKGREKHFRIKYFLPFIDFLILLITSSWYLNDSFTFFLRNKRKRKAFLRSGKLNFVWRAGECGKFNLSVFIFLAFH